MKTPIRFLFTLLCAATLSVQTVHATTITVNSTADPTGAHSGITLRDALAAEANGDMINFSVTTPATITLSAANGQLEVGTSVMITGPGANLLTVDANHASRVFFIDAGTTVTISGLTISNGGSGSFGFSGGILNDHATLTVSNCTLSGNSASFGGGGIFNFGGGFGSATLTINNSTLSGNSANLGGGIYNDASFGSATLTVNNSTLSGNSAFVEGGGIFNDGNNGSATLTVTNSTISGNSTGSFGGGGIYNNGYFGSATLTVTNSTISGNSAGSFEGGGGIYNFGEFGSATLTVNNSTFSGNSAPFTLDVGGIYNDGLNGSATVTIGSTILNAGASGENIFNFSDFPPTAIVTSNGYNLSSDAAGGDGTTGPGGLLNATGDIRNTNPMLAPLANNGGPTFTHALLTGSPAIDQGKNFTAFTSDQRGTGFARTNDFLSISNATLGDGTDIGAYEVQAVVVCPQPQGYWKTNPDAWPASALPMTLGSQTYNKTELLAILNTPIHGDASLILADQLIATKLSIANGADGTPVSSTIMDADMLLTGSPPFIGKLPYKVKTSSSAGQAMINDANVLNNFNNGLLTLGCGL